MTPEDRELHAELQRLFDDTASDASGPTLTKLSARAADVPRLARRSRLWRRWAWGPLFASVACALGIVLALHGARHSAPLQPAPGALTLTPQANLALESASGTALLPPAAHVNASEEANDNLEPLGEADEAAHFDVSGPQSDRDLDAWLAATAELSGGT